MYVQCDGNREAVECYSRQYEKGEVCFSRKWLLQFLVFALIKGFTLSMLQLETPTQPCFYLIYTGQNSTWQGTARTCAMWQCLYCNNWSTGYCNCSHVQKSFTKSFTLTSKQKLLALWIFLSCRCVYMAGLRQILMRKIGILTVPQSP